MRLAPLALLLLAASASAQFAAPPDALRGGSATLPPGFYLEDAVDATFTVPVAVAFAPGGRMFVVEKRGVVRVVQNGVLLPEPFLDIQDEVLNHGDRGLLGIAVDPAFETNRRVFLSYTVDHQSTANSARQDAYARVTSYQGRADNPSVADPASRRVLIGETFATGIPSCYFSHTIGTLAVGADGTLLVGTGDGAHYGRMDDGGEYPVCFQPGKLPASEDIGAFRSLRVQSLAGKILRVNPETGRGLASNPFYTGNPDDTASKVWALGLRNPYRFSMSHDGASTDPSAGDPGTLYVGDVGWTRWEELNVVRGGENFGWPCNEGPGPHTSYQAGTPATNGCSTPMTGTLTGPTFTWHHSDANQSSPRGLAGRAVVGGEIYRGDRYPAEYTGRLFFGDYPNGWTATAPLDALGVPNEVNLFSPDTGPVVNYTYDPASRYIHLVDVWNGRVQRLRHTSEAPNAAPVAEALATPASGGAGLRVQLSAGDSFDPDGDDLSFAWDLGDGRFSDARAPLVTYSTPGDYTAEVAVSDGILISRATVAVRVRAGVAPTISIADETRSARPRAGEPLRLVAEADDPDQSAASLAVRWTVTQVHDSHVHPDVFVADGPTATFTPPEHGLPGEVVYYRIVAEVRDDTGLASTDETALYLGPGPAEADMTGGATPIALASVPGLGALVDGLTPAPGSTSPAGQIRTDTGDPDRPIDWIGLTFPGEQTFTRLTFTEGLHEAVGGWFETLGVQVRQAGVWRDVVDLRVSPAYRAHDDRGYDTYDLRFAAIPGDAIRLAGRPGGDGGYITAAELRAWGLVDPFGPLPSGWAAQDVGSAAAPGQAGWNDGAFTLEGSGDAWGSADAFHLAHHALPEGGEIVARVADLHGTSDWIKAGLVIRESLEPGARYLGLFVSKLGTHVQIRREADEATDGPTDLWGTTAPQWLRLGREAGMVIAEVSADGQTWTEVARETLDLGPTAVAGLGVSAADYGDGRLAWATFTDVTLDLPEPGTWASEDVGNPSGAGATTTEGNDLVVTGGGDVWGDQDRFHFVHQPLPGEGSVITRVASLTGAADWIKGGLVVRASSVPGAPYVGVFASRLGLHFQFRTEADGPSAGPVDLWGLTAPVWLRLDRSGTTIAAFHSADGVAWTPVGTANVAALDGSLLVGLAVSAADYGTGATATARFQSAAVYGSGTTVAPPNNATAASAIGFAIDRVFPNPARGAFTLRATTADDGPLTAEVLDALGRRVAVREVTATGGVTDVTFSARGLPPGTYLVRLRDETTGASALERLTVIR